MTVNFTDHFPKLFQFFANRSTLIILRFIGQWHSKFILKDIITKYNKLLKLQIIWHQLLANRKPTRVITWVYCKAADVNFYLEECFVNRCSRTLQSFSACVHPFLNTLGKSLLERQLTYTLLQSNKWQNENMLKPWKNSYLH